jgi:hypothetical protein
LFCALLFSPVCASFVLTANAKVVEDGYEFFAKRQLVTLFSAPNYCGEFDNAGAMMSVDETLMCSFQVRPVLMCLSLCALFVRALFMFAWSGLF